MERSQRARRGLAWLTLAALVMLVAGLVYLRPALGAPGAPVPQTPAVKRSLPAVVVGRTTFGDGEHGLVEVMSTRPGAPLAVNRYWTADGGRSWRAEPLPPGSAPGFISFIGPQLVLSEEAGGISLSADGGRTWRALTDPRRDPTVTSAPYFLDEDNGWWLEPLSATNTPAPGSHPVNLWRTTDGGLTWSAQAAAGVPEAGMKRLLTIGDSLHGVMTVSPGAPVGNSLGFLTTDDGGRSWRPSVPPDLPVQTLPVFPHVAMRGERIVLCLLAVSNTGGPSTLGGAEASVFTATSFDGGRSWGPLLHGPTFWGGTLSNIPDGAVSSDGSRIVFLEDHELWTSSDHGATWTKRVAVLPEGLLPTALMTVKPDAYFVFARASTAPNGSPEILLRSRDGGIHWERVPLPPAARGLPR